MERRESKVSPAMKDFMAGKKVAGKRTSGYTGEDKGKKDTSKEDRDAKKMDHGLPLTQKKKKKKSNAGRKQLTGASKRASGTAKKRQSY